MEKELRPEVRKQEREKDKEEKERLMNVWDWKQRDPGKRHRDKYPWVTDDEWNLATVSQEQDGTWPPWGAGQ